MKYLYFSASQPKSTRLKGHSHHRDEGESIHGILCFKLVFLDRFILQRPLSVGPASQCSPRHFWTLQTFHDVMCDGGVEVVKWADEHKACMIVLLFKAASRCQPLILLPNSNMWKTRLLSSCPVKSEDGNPVLRLCIKKLAIHHCLIKLDRHLFGFLI